MHPLIIVITAIGFHTDLSDTRLPLRSSIKRAKGRKHRRLLADQSIHQCHLVSARSISFNESRLLPQYRQKPWFIAIIRECEHSEWKKEIQIFSEWKTFDSEKIEAHAKWIRWRFHKVALATCRETVDSILIRQLSPRRKPQPGRSFSWLLVAAVLSLESLFLQAGENKSKMLLWRYG